MEKQYYLHDGTEQQGPFSLEELKAKRPSRETPVWYDGLGSWTHAARLEELSGYFASNPPQFGTTPPVLATAQQQTPSYDESDRKRGLGVLLAVLLIALLVAAGVYYANRAAASDEAEQQSYAERVMTVEEIERSRPADFLSAASEYRENFWGDKLKIRGVITNKATMASYKDAVIRVTYYSKTKTELGARDHTIYESFAPNSNTGFEFKTDNYQDVESIKIALVSAVAE